MKRSGGVGARHEPLKVESSFPLDVLTAVVAAFVLPMLLLSGPFASYRPDPPRTRE